MEYESDLDDLIQSDLHTEMNKILDQSDNTAAVSCKPINKLQKYDSPKPEKQTTSKSIAPKSIVISKKEDDNSASLALLHEVKEIKEKKELLFEESVPISNVAAVKSETLPTGFSGHFSLERFPSTSEAEIHVKKTEQEDLSNLAWLTCVDVQQALQRNDGSLPGVEQIHPGSSFVAEPSSQTSMCVPAASNPQGDNAAFQLGSLNNTPANASCQSEVRPTPRFTPIQPNTNVEGHQRYMMQQTAVGQHALLPVADHMGGSRYGPQGGFRPYPPPPYGTTGSAYIRGGYHHGRFQSQAQKVFPKPVYSYSCLIAMSLRASKTGCLPVSDIYNFMMDNFPYFKTAPDGWKNSVRHNLSLNKCFEKVEKPNGTQRKGCLWALNPAKITKMEEEVQKWKRKDPDAIRKSMSNPEELDRELEEIRRSDEDAARRRMLTMTTHGLSMITSPHGYHPYSRQARHHPGSSHARHMHPSGTASLPTTPQHYHQHRTPFRPTMGPGHCVDVGPSAYQGISDDHNHKRQPRQLFNYPVDQRGYPIGSPDVSSTPITSIKCGGMPDPNAAAQMQNPSLSSPYSSSSSSGNASFFGVLADSAASSGHDLNDIDLDASLADLSAFQGAMWDEHVNLSSHEILTDMPLHSFDDRMGQPSQPHPRIDTSSTMSAIEQATSSEPSQGSDVFGGTPRFDGDLSYYNGNNKTVMLH